MFRESPGGCALFTESIWEWPGLCGWYRLLEPITVKASEYGAPTTRTQVFFYGYDPERVNSLFEADFLPSRSNDVRVKDALALLPSVRASWQTEAQSWRSVGSLGESFFEQRIANFIPTGVGNKQAIREYRKSRLVSGFLGTLHQRRTVRRFFVESWGD